MSEQNPATQGVAEQITALAETMKAKIDSVQALAAEGQKATGETKQEIAKIAADLGKLNLQLAEQEARFTAVDLHGTGVKSGSDFDPVARMSREARKPVTREQVNEYGKAFEAYLRGGQRTPGAAIQNALSVGSETAGGYLVPPDMSRQIERRIFDFSPFRQYANVTQVSGDSLKGITQRTGAGYQWIGERAGGSNTTTPEFNQWEFGVHKLNAYPTVTPELLEDGFVDVQSWLTGEIADALARGEGNAFVVGDGAAKPRGFTTYTTAATGDNSRTWGQLEHVVSGANGAFASSNPLNPFISLLHKFRSGYLPGSVWVMNRPTLAALRSQADANEQYYLLPNAGGGFTPTLLGFPIIEMDDMPAYTTTGNLGVAFGNFRLGYQIVEKPGFRALVDPYTDKGLVQFHTTKRVGGGVKHFDTIKFIKFST